MSTPETKHTPEAMFYTRDKKFPHQKENISTTEQKSKENILTVRKIFLSKKKN